MNNLILERKSKKSFQDIKNLSGWGRAGIIKLGENVISFISDFPRELGIEKYVDYDLQFSKSFLEPLKIILDSIGWSFEKKVTLESFFS